MAFCRAQCWRGGDGLCPPAPVLTSHHFTVSAMNIATQTRRLEHCPPPVGFSGLRAISFCFYSWLVVVCRRSCGMWDGSFRSHFWCSMKIEEVRPEIFDAILKGEKRYKVVRDYSGHKVGDIILLRNGKEETKAKIVYCSPTSRATPHHNYLVVEFEHYFED